MECKYLSVTQFAKACMVTPQAVRKMIKEKRLKAIMVGKQYIIPCLELDKYLKTKIR
jgi:excisionase family DNA binding protein